MDFYYYNDSADSMFILILNDFCKSIFIEARWKIKRLAVLVVRSSFWWLKAKKN